MKIESCTVDVKSKKELHAVEDVCFAQDIVWCGSGRQHISLCGGENVLISDDDLSTTSSEHPEIPRYTAKEFIEKFGENKNKLKHRIKTEKEFIKEFGEDWRSEMDNNCGFVDSMDFLFGHILTKSEEKKYSMSTDFNSDVGSWSISGDMITEIKQTKSKAKAKHRIKTKEEFIEEFGDNWEGKAAWNNCGEMDYLFGHELTEDEEKEYLSISGSFMIDDSWMLNKNTITEVKQDKPKWNIIDKFISTPKVTLNDSLYRHRKVKLNQNK